MLGSVHSVLAGGSTLEISEPGGDPAIDPEARMRGHSEELVALINGRIKLKFWLISGTRDASGRPPGGGTSPAIITT